MLRKFFRTKLGSVIPVDVVEALMGHEGYLTEVYRRYSVEDLAKFYKQGEHALLVFTEAAEVGRLRQEIEERNSQLQSPRVCFAWFRTGQIWEGAQRGEKQR